MCLWDSTLQKRLISGFFLIAASRYTFGNVFEITKNPNESMGERGPSARFQRLWDASDKKRSVHYWEKGKRSALAAPSPVAKEMPNRTWRSQTVV